MPSEALRDLTNVVFLRREAIADGYTDRAIRSMLKSGEWHRVRTGAYVSGPLWRELSVGDRHRVRARAVLRTSHPSTVLSHLSAALEHGAPVWGVDLTEVHVTRTDGKPRRREAGVVHHRGELDMDEVVLLNDVHVTSPLRSAVEVTTIAPVEAALVTVDGLLRSARPTQEAVAAARTVSRHWPNSLTTEVVFRLADPRRESAAETRAFYLCWAYGLPRPEPQVEILDERGRLFARVDFAWTRLGVFLEVDGTAKYAQHRRPGETLDQFLLREKRREEQICQFTGWVCIRIRWADLEQPATTAMRIRRILDSRSAA